MNTRLFSLAALALLPLAVLAGPAEDLKSADESFNRGDLPTAMALLRKAADANYGPAQARLGDLLLAAEYDEEAVALFRKAAAQGDPAGETGLGRVYADARGVKRDPAAALEWYRKAEKKNHLPALDALARAYHAGDLGLPKDAQKAAEYAARAGTVLTQPRAPRTAKK
ncbi:MAG: sel1 repeat family protein [Burkholderiales bacterium]|nr:sel1 repeat family protein [Burkholderiales bacterium]